jgi:hypothetical protein
LISLETANPFGAFDGSPFSKADPTGDFSLPDPAAIHKAMCRKLASLIQSFLTTQQDIGGWQNFVSGTGGDINLSEDQMTSLLSSVPEYANALSKIKSSCQSSGGYSGSVDGTAQNPWHLSIGRVHITVTASCSKCPKCNSVTASINDRYDFDPEVWSTLSGHGRTILNETKTDLVRAAQLAGQCGWKEFNYTGSTTVKEGACSDGNKK